MSKSTYQVAIQSGDEIGVMVEECFNSLGGINKLISPGRKILLKPNLVVEKPNSSGATTNPLLLAAVIDSVMKTNPAEVTIGESSGVGNSTMRAYQVAGIDRVARQRGVRLIDFKADRQVALKVERGRALHEVRVAETITKIDFLINMPILKVHSQTKVTCGLKNLKGCISDQEKRRFHRLDLEQCIADLNTLIRTELTVVDATTSSFAWEEGGSPVRLDTVMASSNVVAADAVAASLLGYHPSEIGHLQAAARHGLGPASLDSIDLLKPAHFNGLPLDRSSDRVSYKLPGVDIFEQGACTPCMGALLAALRRFSKEGTRLQCRIILGQNAAQSRVLWADGKRLVGIGDCGCQLAGLDRSVAGCPPAALEVFRVLSGFGLPGQG